MPGYWWQCTECSTTCSLKSISKKRGIPTFVRDVMVPSRWDQNNLIAICSKCELNAMRISYKFPRQKDPELVHVISMVGLKKGEYIPMMWETYIFPKETETYFDFKYTYKNQNWGLNTPAILTQQDLKAIFRLYMSVKGVSKFP